MSKSPTRTALIGAGYIATWHADALRATKNADLVAIVDPSAAAAEDLASAYNVSAFGSLEELVESGSCDAVHILTPPHLHRDLAVQALEAGLHAFVEKPVAISQAETADIEAAAQASGKLFGAGHNFLGLPSYQRLKKAVELGTLGRIASAEINWRFPLAPLRSGPFGLWLLREPRNLLLELGPHLFAFAEDLFGTPQIEHLSLGKLIELPAGAGERPQSWRIIARAGDVDITFNLSIVETMDDRSVVVHGSSGVAHLDYATDALTIRQENASDIVANALRGQVGQAWQHLREGGVNATRQLTSLNRKSPYGLSFQGAVQSFYDAIQNGSALDDRFAGVSAEKIMGAIDATLALLPDMPKPKLPKAKRKPKPSALVIGGTGFIGRQLTRSLVASGRDVRVLSRGRSGPFDDLPEQVETVSVSLRDADGLRAAMEGIDAVYHLAKSMDKTWEGCLENDVGVTRRIAEAALDSGVRRFVYTGTIASYDMSASDGVITEDTGFAEDMEDRNLYARSKAECERMLTEMHKDQGLPLIIARPGIVVGAGGPLQHWGIGRWHGAGAVRIWGNGKNTLPFVLIEDVADALVTMLDVEEAVGQSFNLVGDQMMSARDYFDAIHETLGARIKVYPGALHGFFLADGAKHLMKKYLLQKPNLTRASLKDWKSRAHFTPFSNTKPKKVLGWSPETDKNEFVRRAITEANLFGF